jgi:predicted nucleic acid-binding protein
MLVFDSSFLISLYRPSDSNNAKAIATMGEKKEEVVLLCHEVLFETLSVLNVKDGIGRAREAYEDLTRNPKVRLVHLEEKDKIGALNEFFAGAGRLSPTDALVIRLAKTRGSLPLAYDKEILKAF